MSREMLLAFCALYIGLSVLYWGAQAEARRAERRFERERAAWERERAALLERCLPGFVYPAPEPETRPEAVDVDPEAAHFEAWMRGEDL